MSMSAFALAVSVAAFAPSLPSAAPAYAPTMKAADEIGAVCPVCGKAIATGQGSKVMIRDQEYTVDGIACGEKLTADPDKYLNADGTPKNGKKSPKKDPKHP